MYGESSKKLFEMRLEVSGRKQKLPQKREIDGRDFINLARFKINQACEITP